MSSSSIKRAELGNPVSCRTARNFAIFFNVPLNEIILGNQADSINLIDPKPLASLIESHTHCSTRIIWCYALQLEGTKHRNIINSLCLQLLSVLAESQDQNISRALINSQLYPHQTQTDRDSGHQYQQLNLTLGDP